MRWPHKPPPVGTFDILIPTIMCVGRYVNGVNLLTVGVFCLFVFAKIRVFACPYSFVRSDNLRQGYVR